MVNHEEQVIIIKGLLNKHLKPQKAFKSFISDFISKNTKLFDDIIFCDNFITFFPEFVRHIEAEKFLGSNAEKTLPIGNYIQWVLENIIQINNPSLLIKYNDLFQGANVTGRRTFFLCHFIQFTQNVKPPLDEKALIVLINYLPLILELDKAKVESFLTNLRSAVLFIETLEQKGYVFNQQFREIVFSYKSSESPLFKHFEYLFILMANPEYQTIFTEYPHLLTVLTLPIIRKAEYSSAAELLKGFDLEKEKKNIVNIYTKTLYFSLNFVQYKEFVNDLISKKECFKDQWQDIIEQCNQNQLSLEPTDPITPVIEKNINVIKTTLNSIQSQQHNQKSTENLADNHLATPHTSLNSISETQQDNIQATENLADNHLATPHASLNSISETQQDNKKSTENLVDNHLAAPQTSLKPIPETQQDNPEVPLNTTQSVKQLTSDVLKKCIKTATEKYIQHTISLHRPKNLTSETNHARGKYGLFTTWRHGVGGIDTAKTFNTIIQSASNVKNITDQLEDFFNRKTTRFERHSYSSYLLDELSFALPVNPIKPRIYRGKPENYTQNSWKILKQELLKSSASEIPQMPSINKIR